MCSDFNIHSNRSELIKLGDAWSKNKLKKVDPKDVKLMKKAYKILSDPAKKGNITEAEYNTLKEALQKLPPSSDKRSFNIFRKIHMPWSNESKVISYMKKAEKADEKELFSGLNKQGVKHVNQYFKENPIAPADKAEMIAFAKLVPDKWKGSLQIVPMLDFAKENLITATPKNKELIMQFTQVILSDEKNVPTKILPDIKNFCDRERGQKDEIMKFIKDPEYSNFLGKTPEKQVAFFKFYNELINRTKSPVDRLKIILFTRSLIRDENVNAIEILRRSEALLKKTHYDPSIQEFVIKYKGEDIYDLMMSLIEETHPISLIAFIENTLKDKHIPIEMGEMASLVKELGKIPEKDREFYLAFAGRLIDKGMNEGVLGTCLSILQKVPRETLEQIKDEDIPVLFKDLELDERKTFLYNIFGIPFKALAKIPPGKEAEALEYARQHEGKIPSFD